MFKKLFEKIEERDERRIREKVELLAAIRESAKNDAYNVMHKEED